MDTKQARSEMVAQYASAKNNRDIDKALEFCAPDIELISRTIDDEKIYRGAENVRQGVMNFFNLFSEYHGRSDAQFQAGSALVSIGEVRLKVDQKLVKGTSQPTIYQAPYIALYEFRETLIIRERYFPEINLSNIIADLHPDAVAAISVL